jgi:serine/threonine protein kinase
MPPSIAQRHLPIHATLQNGKYRILSLLGQGGFGITYLAEHHYFKKQVAIKELFINSGDVYCSRENTTNQQVIPNFDKARFEAFKQRFSEEARTLLSLSSIEGVVKVLDIFEENDTIYFSMDFLDGDKLDDYIAKKQKLSEKEALDLINQLGNTLSAVHERKVLHRDIKPSNIIVKKDGHPVLIDFGIARTYEDMGEINHTHTTFHSPRFSPPEQKVAKSPMGEFSDVYALGATAYLMLTGEQPQSSDERAMHGYISPKELNPSLSDTINAAINKSLEQSPQKRFSTVKSFLESLNGQVNTPPQYLTPILAEKLPEIAKTDATVIEKAKKTNGLDATVLEYETKNTLENQETKILPLENTPAANDKTEILTHEKAPIDSDKTEILSNEELPMPPRKKKSALVWLLPTAAVAGLGIYFMVLRPKIVTPPVVVEKAGEAKPPVPPTSVPTSDSSSLVSIGVEKPDNKGVVPPPTNPNKRNTKPPVLSKPPKPDPVKTQSLETLFMRNIVHFWRYTGKEILVTRADKSYTIFKKDKNGELKDVKGNGMWGTSQISEFNTAMTFFNEKNEAIMIVKVINPFNSNIELEVVNDFKNGLKTGTRITK